MYSATATHGTKERRLVDADIRHLDDETLLRHGREVASRSDGELVQPDRGTFQNPITKPYTLVPKFRLRKRGNGELPSDGEKKFKRIAQALREFNVETPLWCEGVVISPSNGEYAQQHDVDTIHPPPTTSHLSATKFRLKARKNEEPSGDGDKKMNDIGAKNGATAASKPRSVVQVCAPEARVSLIRSYISFV